MVRFHVLAPDFMTLEIGQFIINFATMKVSSTNFGYNDYDVLILNETIYMGHKGPSEKYGVTGIWPGSWSYFGGSQDAAKRAFEMYATYLLEKALGLEEV